jgi:LCP family protein required for cell wall assembly
MARRFLAAIRRAPIVAATLSFLLPGAGQAWAGKVGRGLVFVTPIVLLLIGGGAVLTTQGTAHTLGLALQPGVLLGFVALNLALAAWRVAAIVDAYLIARRRWPEAGGREPRWISVAVMVALLVVTLGTHAGLGYVGYQTYDTVTTVFATPSPDPPPDPTPMPTADGPSATPRPAWSPTPAPSVAPEIWSSDGRLDILLMGLDEGPGRFSLRPDAMILLSVDMATGRAALFGIPRYLQNVPLPLRSVNAFACRCFPGYINALFRHAEDNPVWFAGADRERGLRATEEAIGAMVGLELDGRLVINFNGFMRLVDVLGGVTINVPDALYDWAYEKPDGSGMMEISFAPGVQWMDGFRALAYARTRHQDSDYDRMWRQQWVLLALRRQMDPCRLVTRLPELLQIAGDTVSTNLPVEQLPALLDLTARVRPDAIARYQFWPPDIPSELDAAAIDTIRSMVRDPFPAPPTLAPGAAPTPGPSLPPQPTPGPAC